ncbi:NADPH-dependent FMN reductase [Streptomyces roseochromogenus]|uniref:NADPH-dependent FMN reductase n=1 Tax=Streptomyces roseochromogenus TaxID=285450 RepID=UPI001FD82658|nr:NAD(P)H-dependent oxidoreductase [Streptomyces roseochromogenus]
MSDVTVAGIGGSLRPGSATETVLRVALTEVERLGGRTLCVTAGDLNVPLYDWGSPRGPKERYLVEVMASADALILATPTYHGGMSGLVKNALDYAEDLRGRRAPYFSGRPVGLIALAQGAQGGASALASLRTTVHALRGWPTPLGVAVDTSRTRFDPDGRCQDPHIQSQLEILASQLVDFASCRTVRSLPGANTEPAWA